MEVEKFETDPTKNPDMRKVKQFNNDFEDSLMISDICLACLVALEAKPAADIEGFFEKEEIFTEFVSTLNDLGINVYIQKNPESTVAESFADMFEDENLNEKFENPEIKARIFISSEKNELGKIKTICKGSNTSKYHRKYGEFLGFKEENIEAFVYDMQPKWRKIFSRLGKNSPKNTINDYQAIQKYGKNLEKRQKQIFSAFTFQVMVDKEKMFEKMREKTRERKKAVERSDLELETFLDSLSDPRTL